MVLIQAGLVQFGSVKHYGGMSDTSSETAIHVFQNDPNCRVFVGSVIASAQGITLTAANVVVFAELDWRPGKVSQAEDRAHRIGQLMNVLVHHLVFAETIDVQLAETVVKKQEWMDRLTSDALRREALDELEPDILTAVGETGGESGGDDTELAEFEAEEVREKLHRQLKTLAFLCDGANAKDGMGFNALDTGIGHELASRDKLTPKQARLADRILHKYQSQFKNIEDQSKEMALAE